MHAIMRVRLLPWQGKWSEEEDKTLIKLVEERGRHWVEIGAAVGRMPAVCRDRYRYLKLGTRRRVGRWTSEEEASLQEIVEEQLELHQVVLCSCLPFYTRRKKWHCPYGTGF